VLEEVEMPKPLGLGVVDRMDALDAGCRKSCSRGKVDTDRQGLPGRVEINVADKPGLANAKGRFKELILHARSDAANAGGGNLRPPAANPRRLLGPVKTASTQLPRCARAAGSLRSHLDRPCAARAPDRRSAPRNGLSVSPRNVSKIGGNSLHTHRAPPAAAHVRR